MDKHQERDFSAAAGSARLRCLAKGAESGQWVQEFPEDVIKWLFAHDGKEAVVVDDAKPKTFYCATEELRQQYLDEGKRALMFIDLARKLHDESPSVDPSTSPMWCKTYSLICSEREECKDDCCYRPKEES